MSPARLTRSVACACAALGAMELLGVWLTRPSDAVTLRALALAVAPAWLLLAVAGSLYARLALSWRITWPSWRTRLPLHVLAALVLAVGVLAMDTLIQHDPAGLTRRAGFALLVEMYLANAAVMTLGFVALVHALIARDIAMQQEAARLELAERVVAARAEADAGRLDPGFVFDTLQRIERMAVRGEQGRVADAIGAFGEVLRAGLERDPARMAVLRRELLEELPASDQGSSACR